MDKKNLKRLTWFVIGSIEALILLLAFVSITRAQVRNAPPYYGALDGSVYFPVTNRGFNYSVTAQQLKDSLGGGSVDGKTIYNSDGRINAVDRWVNVGINDSIEQLDGDGDTTTVHFDNGNLNFIGYGDTLTLGGKPLLGQLFGLSLKHGNIMAGGNISAGGGLSAAAALTVGTHVEHGAYSYLFPNESGTFALTSDIPAPVDVPTIYSDDGTIPGNRMITLADDKLLSIIEGSYKSSFTLGDGGMSISATNRIDMHGVDVGLAGDSLLILNAGGYTTPTGLKGLLLNSTNSNSKFASLKTDKLNASQKNFYFPNESGTFLLDADTATLVGTKNDFAKENLQKVTDRGATTDHSVTAKDYIIDDGSSSYSGSVVFKYDDGTTNSMSENDGGRYIEYHNGSATTDGNPAGWRFGGQVMGAPATRDSNFVTLLQMRDSICNGSCSGSGKNIGTDNLEIMDSSRYLTYKPGVFSSGIVVGDTTSAFGSYFKMGRVTSFIRNNASPFSIINAGGGINILDSSAVGMNVYSGYNLDISTGAAMSISSNQDMTFNSFNATVNAGGSIGLTSTGGMITVSTPAPIQLSSGSSPIQLYAGAGAPVQISTDAGSNGVNLFTHNVTGFQNYEMPNESGTVLLDADTATLLATKNHRPETYTGDDTITADGESGFFTITTTIPAGATYYNIVATDSGTAGVLKTTGYFLSQSGSSLSINFVTPPAAGTYKIKWIAVY